MPEERKQITLISNVIPIVEGMAKEEQRSFPNMVIVLLWEAITARNKSFTERKDNGKHLHD